MLGEGVAVPGEKSGKYQLDLWLANKMILQQGGIPEERIAVTDICTSHNSSYLFSHRASGGRRGNIGVFLMLREEHGRKDAANRTREPSESAR